MGASERAVVAATETARFAEHVANSLCRDARRIVVIGAGGWIGRSAIEMLNAALGGREFNRRVACFGSSQRELALTDGTRVRQQALTALSALPPMPSIVLHLAFLTKDKVAGMSEADFIGGNRKISDAVHAALDVICADRLFVASSGAAAFADDPSAPADLRLYGRLKLEDEQRFSEWAEARTHRRVVIGRLYALSGPFINKPETYALADLILAVLNGQPACVRAPNAVFRSYVAVREMISLIFALMLADDATAVTRFETGGQPLELGTLAEIVADVLGGRSVIREPAEGSANRYLGNHAEWERLLARNSLDHLSIGCQVAETAAWLRAIGIAEAFG